MGLKIKPAPLITMLTLPFQKRELGAFAKSIELSGCVSMKWKLRGVVDSAYYVAGKGTNTDRGQE